MTENSSLIFQWEIDNANARFATGKVESGVFSEGGFKWIAAVEKSYDAYTDFSLQCGVDHNGPWKCEVNMRVYVDFLGGGYINCIEDDRFIFNESSCLWQDQSNFLWSDLNDLSYNINDTATLEFRLNIVSSEIGVPIAEPSKFVAPNNKSNVILKIGNEKLHVYKELLALHSPVFDTLFFGDFAEKGKEEVEIKDVVYEEFIDLLNLIYLRTMDITDRTVLHILKLADQFQMEEIFAQCKKYLTHSKGIDVVTKLMLADQYRFVSLMDNCLKSFTSVSDLTRKMKSSPEYANFSGGMKIAICDRIIELTDAN